MNCMLRKRNKELIKTHIPRPWKICIRVHEHNQLLSQQVLPLSAYTPVGSKEEYMNQFQIP
jgi:hypothetical protein